MSSGWASRLSHRARTLVTFPLLAKELTETAARCRTYLLRVIYAIALYAVFALLLPPGTWEGGGNRNFGAMGTGGRMFETLIAMQYFGMMLFLPALMCGRITQEKERDSLVLLFLTELRPWSIILQKYAGGLLLMLSFFLLGLPLAGVAYAFGGLDGAEGARMLIGILLMSLQVGAIALLCSSWCRSTVGAFISTYLVCVLFYLGPPLLAEMVEAFGPQDANRLELTEYAFLLLPPAALARNVSVFASRWSLAIAPSLVSIVVSLILARVFLVRRALVPPSNFLRRLFVRIDGVMKYLNRATGGIVFWHDSASLPANDPVFWRETQRRVLGKPHYLIRVLYLVEIPTLTLALFVALAGDNGYRGQSEALAALVGLLAVLAALFVSVHAANSLVSERVGQTLEVLLTTPLSAQEIVRQKERALWRLLLVIAAPLLTVFVCEATVEGGRFGTEWGTSIAYLTCALLLMLIYLPMITWLSLWISLRVRTRFQAIIAAVGILAFWAALCPLIFYLGYHSDFYRSPWQYALFLSPVSVGFLNETGELDKLLGSSWLAILFNAALYSGIALQIRRKLFADAEKLLRS